MSMPPNRFPSRSGAHRVARRTILFVTVGLGLIPPPLIPASGAPAELVVSPTGDDANPGTVEKPLATLERARAALREMKKAGPLPAGGATIWIEDGLYLRDGSFELGTEDSGAPSAPVTYRARHPGRARVVGARVVKAAAFRPVTDPAILERLDPAARGQVRVLDLAAGGIRHVGPFPDVFDGRGGIVELFFDGKRMPLSRYPNDGFMTMKKVLDNGDRKRGGVFEYRDDRTRRWKAAVAEGLWLKGYWRVAWQNEAVRVASIDFDSNTIAHLKGVAGGIGSKYKRPHGSGKERYWALNVLDEIDRPGEWCIVFPAKKLFFWPPTSLDKSEVLIADLDAPLFSMKDASHIVLRGLVVEGGLGNGVEIRGGTACAVAGCTLRNLAGWGVLADGGTKHTVRSSDLYALGGGGIDLRGGDRKTLTPAGHAAVNNHIHHYGEIQRVYAAAVRAGFRSNAVGMRVAHNLVHDAPHVGILFGGNDHVFEFNEVFRICLVSNDMGAFYANGDWTSRGNLIRYNFVHHSPQAHGVYCDDGDSGDTALGNIFVGIDAGVFIGGGHDNVARNNIAVDCKKALHVDARGVSRGYNLQNRRMVGAVRAVNHQQPPWSVRYPEMMKILEFHPELPTGNIFERNVAVRCSKLLNRSGKPEQLKHLKIGTNLALDTDPGFRDAARLDFRLRPDAGIFRKLEGFEPIPFGKIGLYTDTDRRTLPAASALNRTSSVGVDGKNDADPLNR